MGEAATSLLVAEALRIRAFAQHLSDLQEAGKLAGDAGHAHTSLGREVCAAALWSLLRPGRDAFFAEQRGLAHLIALGAPLDGLLAELMGREGALFRGRGGGWSLPSERFFGGTPPAGAALLATGYAWVTKQRGSEEVVVAQVTHESTQVGALYEALLCAAAFELPLLFYLEWSEQTIPTVGRKQTAATIAARIAGFDVEAHVCSDQNVDLLRKKLGVAVEQARHGRPQALVVETEAGESAEALEDQRSRDALSEALESMSARKSFAVAKREVRAVSNQVRARPPVGSKKLPALPSSARRLNSAELHVEGTRASGGDAATIAVQLDEALLTLANEREDIVSVETSPTAPRQRAKEVTRRPVRALSGRVVAALTSEAGLAGFCNGAAIAGLRPVGAIDSSDLAALDADRLLAYAGTLNSSSGGEVVCPITMRLTSRAGDGEELTSSQSLEPRLLGVPGLRVLALSHRHHPRRLLELAILDDAPTILVEHELLHSMRPPNAAPLDLDARFHETRAGDAPCLSYSPPRGIAPQVTLVTFGGMAPTCDAAMRALFVEDEIAFDYFILTQLSPIGGVEPIIDSVLRTRRLLFVEAGAPRFGVGAALISTVVQRRPETRALTVVPRDTFVKSTETLTQRLIPSASDIIDAVLELTGEETR